MSIIQAKTLPPPPPYQKWLICRDPFLFFEKISELASICLPPSFCTYFHFVFVIQIPTQNEKKQINIQNSHANSIEIHHESLSKQVLKKSAKKWAKYLLYFLIDLWMLSNSFIHKSYFKAQSYFEKKTSISAQKDAKMHPSAQFLTCPDLIDISRRVM